MNLTRGTYALMALITALLWIALGNFFSLPAAVAKLLFDQGPGSFFPYPLTLQNLMWFIFFIGLGELGYRLQHIQCALDALRQRYLPEQDDIVLTLQDMGTLYKSVKTRDNELAELIKSLVLRFQAGRSVEQTHEMLTTQLELRQYRLDIDYNMLRYLSWLIPTLGFIGTVIGIAQTLNYAGSDGTDPTAPQFLADITMRLGVAFDTTLLALVMSAILVFCTHLVQGREERVIVQSGQYCLNYLIARLYIQN
ncbi:MAG: hypothetical protein CVV06_12435 [Gammaproteobacteria bacterium HGW-Gammaproteobacteria-10]|nr:MAG: hypothetical protein CVV06_12435 [Gammaproteobacteria bacterium HGW-Gammaproteobacteria-10]